MIDPSVYSDYTPPLKKIEKIVHDFNWTTALKFVGIGFTFMIFSPIIVPIYLCYATGKTVMMYWDKL